MQMTPDAEILAMITSILVTILVVAGILSLVTYIFSSLGFYTLAKRRGILHPGLAWVPVCGARWIMGSLADQYVYFTEGKIKYQRRLLLWLEVGMYVLLGLFFALVGGLVAGAVLQNETQAVTMAIWMLLDCFLLLVEIIVFAVFQYIALHKIYKSCDPKNTTLFLVLSILFNITMPFFLFACRKKDLGMPQPEAPEGEPAEEPTQLPEAQEPEEEPGQEAYRPNGHR